MTEKFKLIIQEHEFVCDTPKELNDFIKDFLDAGIFLIRTERIAIGNPEVELPKVKYSKNHRKWDDVKINCIKDLLQQGLNSDAMVVKLNERFPNLNCTKSKLGALIYYKQLKRSEVEEPEEAAIIDWIKVNYFKMNEGRCREKLNEVFRKKISYMQFAHLRRKADLEKGIKTPDAKEDEDE